MYASVIKSICCARRPTWSWSAHDSAEMNIYKFCQKGEGSQDAEDFTKELKREDSCASFSEALSCLRGSQAAPKKKLTFYFLKNKGVPFVFCLIFFSNLDLNKVSALRKGVSSKGEFLLCVYIHIPHSW